MKTITTLLCIAIFLLNNFNLSGQIIPSNHTISEHLMSHVKPGMSAFQIDSLHEIAQNNLNRNEEELKALIIAAQKANKANHSLKSDCTGQNWGFEQGNTSNWQTFGCVQIENVGNDTYSGYSKVNQGNHSLKLSNDMSTNCINSGIARTYSVPATGETFITIHFAVNIFNFPHPANWAASFNFNLYDDNFNKLSCPTYQAYYAVDEGPVGIPGLQETLFPANFYNPFVAGDLWFNSNVSYSNWHHVTIDLSQYAGTDITMVFQNKWCAFNIDWIYTYIDVDCPVNNSQPIPVCTQKEVELCAPQGLSASYSWEYNDVLLENSESCITVSDFGTYTLNFMPAYLECSKTPYEINFEIISQPNADFTVADFCIGQPVVVENLSNFVEDYEWHYNGSILSSETPNLIYVEGQDEIMLITITGNCRDTLIKPLVARKNPIAKFVFENQCYGIPYKIVNQSEDLENGPLNVSWNISSNYQSSNWIPIYTPENNDEFLISLHVTNQHGCTAEFESKAQPYGHPIANFSQSENILSENTAIAHFIDESSNDVTSWNWVIGNDEVYNGADFYYEFLGAGVFNVYLIVKNEFGCIDSAQNQIEVQSSLTVYVPNTFTPNGDENNQLFFPVFSGSNLDRKSYSFQIFNRWGELVFQTKDLLEGWDGLINGIPCTQGTYSWKIQYKEIKDSEVKHLIGHVNLVR